MQVYLLMYKTNFFFIGWNTHTELKRSGNEVAVQTLAFRDNRADRRGALRLLFIGRNTHTAPNRSGNEVAVQALAFRDNRADRRGALRLLRTQFLPYSLNRIIHRFLTLSKFFGNLPI